MSKYTWPILLIVCSSVVATEHRDPLGGFGEEISHVRDEMSAEMRAQLERRRQANVARLIQENKLSPVPSGTTPAFLWPIGTSASHQDVTGISNFVDVDERTPDRIRDFNCGQRTYDTPFGYNHQGVDFFTWPFPWYRMERDEVWAKAVAAGTIVIKDDGNFDQSCSLNNTPWNVVFIQHDDGSTTVYGHLKSGTLTPKQMGDRVEAGEYIGVIGSSGSSTGPHLHLETINSEGRVIEPFDGTCNNLTDESWWLDQRPYYDSNLNLLATHDHPPQFNTCPETETPNFKTVFNAGDTLYVAGYFRDQLASQLTIYRVFDPAGNEHVSWSHRFFNPAHYAASHWYWDVDLPADAMPGRWRVQAEYEDQVESVEFTVVDANFAVNEGLVGVWQFFDDGRAVADVGMVLQLVKAEDHPLGENAFVAALFTHDLPAGKFDGETQRWFTLQGQYTPGSTSIKSIPVFHVLNGIFDGSVPGQTEQAGVADIDFYSCSDGEIRLQLFDDIDVIWTMQRTFREATDFCDSLISP